MTHSIEELEGLVERLEKADGPDWELDKELQWVRDGCHVINGEKRLFAFYHVEHGDCYRPMTRGQAREPYTVSLDAAIALCSAVLPGRWRDLLADALISSMRFRSDDTPHRIIKGFLIAMTKALIEKVKAEQ